LGHLRRVASFFFARLCAANLAYADGSKNGAPPYRRPLRNPLPSLAKSQPASALEQCEGSKAAEKQRATHAPEPRAPARDQRRIAARRFQSQDRGARGHGVAAFPAGARERQDKLELQGRCGSPLILESTRGPCRGSSSPHSPSRDGRPSDALWWGRIKEWIAPTYAKKGPSRIRQSPRPARPPTPTRLHIGRSEERPSFDGL
jgi:hypothetical protein